MTLDAAMLNQMITAQENGQPVTAAELELLESAVLSGAVSDFSRKGLPLLGIRAKTKLFERTFYLLESVRLLALNGRHEQLRSVITKILEELQGKCYGQFCPVGECFEASVCVLRFLRAVCPSETEWISRMTEGILAHRGDRVRTKAVQRYVESALR